MPRRQSHPRAGQPQRTFSFAHGRRIRVSKDQRDLLDNPQPQFSTVPVGSPNDQQQSPFWRLPPEVRLIIYGYVYTGHPLLFICSYIDRHKRCRLAHITRDRWSARRVGEIKELRHWPSNSHFNWTVNFRNHNYPKDQLLALCLACRSSYIEALPVLLSHMTYTIYHPYRVLSVDNSRLGTLRLVQKLHIFIPRTILCALCPPDLDSWQWADWCIVCRTLASMPNLRHLRITLNALSYPPLSDPDFVRIMMEPLGHIKLQGLGSDQQGARASTQENKSTSNMELRQWELVTKGWEVPFELDAGLPYRVRSEPHEYFFQSKDQDLPALNF